jgi:cytochrome c oxidase subunit II
MERLLGLPVLASEHGKSVDDLIIYVHWLMIALFVGWMAYFVLALFRFRQSRQPKADYVGVRGPWSNWIEGAVVLVEGILLIGFAIPLWAAAADKFPAEKDATVINLAAQQFAWNLRYAGPDGKFGQQDMKLVTATNPLGVDDKDPAAKDDIQLLNEMHVPVNKPVIVNITSKDVIHSFKVIALRITQDAIPGLRIPTWFIPTKEGRYQINCAQLCGNGHYGMAQGFLIVESEDAYKKWIEGKSKAGGATSFE